MYNPQLICSFEELRIFINHDLTAFFAKNGWKTRQGRISVVSAHSNQGSKCKRKQVRLNNIKEDQALNKDVHYQGIAKLAFECTCGENTSKVTSN